MKKILLVLAILISARITAQSVKISSDENIDWKPYKTFTVAPGELVTVLKNEVDEDVILDQIRKAIISELESRGFDYVTDGNAQLVVDFTGEAVETTTVEEVGPLGQEPADEPIEMEQSQTWTQNRRQGSLAIDISDQKSNKSLWRSTITIEFSSNELAVIFNGAVGRSLRKFQGKKK
jgi:hypothetical protein